MVAGLSRSYLIKVMGYAFVEAACSGHRHRVVHVNDISLVPYHFQLSIATVETCRNVT